MNFVSKRKKIAEGLRTVMDPEIGMNIVDVGLIYDIKINEENFVIIEMSLTTPGCPLSDYFLSEIESVVSEIDFVDDLRIDFVWDPVWELSMMNEDAKLEMFRSFK